MMDIRSISEKCFLLFVSHAVARCFWTPKERHFFINGDNVVSNIQKICYCWSGAVKTINARSVHVWSVAWRVQLGLVYVIHYTQLQSFLFDTNAYNCAVLHNRSIKSVRVACMCDQSLTVQYRIEMHSLVFSVFDFCSCYAPAIRCTASM